MGEVHTSQLHTELLPACKEILASNSLRGQARKLALGQVITYWPKGGGFNADE